MRCHFDSSQSVIEALVNCARKTLQLRVAPLAASTHVSRVISLNFSRCLTNDCILISSGKALLVLHSPSTEIRFARPCGTTGNRFFSCKRPISHTCLRDWVTIARENSRQQQRRSRRRWWWLMTTTMNIRASILHCTYHVYICAERCNCAIGGVGHGERSIRWVILDGTYVRTVTRCNRNRIEGGGGEMTGKRIIFSSRPNRWHISQFASRFLVVCASSSFR